MIFNKDVVEAIGHTPLIKLKRASELTGCTILGKALCDDATNTTGSTCNNCYFSSKICHNLNYC